MVFSMMIAYVEMWYISTGEEREPPAYLDPPTHAPLQEMREKKSDRMPATRSQKTAGLQAVKQDLTHCNRASTRLRKKNYEEWKLPHQLTCADIGASSRNILSFSCANCDNFSNAKIDSIGTKHEFTKQSDAGYQMECQSKKPITVKVAVGHDPSLPDIEAAAHSPQRKSTSMPASCQMATAVTISNVKKARSMKENSVHLASVVEDLTSQLQGSKLRVS